MHKTVGYAALGLTVYYFTRNFFANLASKIGLSFV
jgi:hypothetical protein